MALRNIQRFPGLAGLLGLPWGHASMEISGWIFSPSSSAYNYFTRIPHSIQQTLKAAPDSRPALINLFQRGPMCFLSMIPLVLTVSFSPQVSQNSFLPQTLSAPCTSYTVQTQLTDPQKAMDGWKDGCLVARRCHV